MRHTRQIARSPGPSVIVTQKRWERHGVRNRMGFIGMHASQARLQAGIRSTWVPVQHGIIDSIVVG